MLKQGENRWIYAHYFVGLENGIVLLVPGTALNGKDSYSTGPFVQLLPKEGFDVCWVSPPNQQLADAQVGGEYVANAVIQLAKKSKTGKVKVLGHSQGGGLSVPWATIFFPTARKLISSFVGMAADFHGTTLLPYPACAAEKILALGAGCSAAILQQEKGSMMLTAQLHFLTKQIVPTTSIFTRTDEIVIPQFGPNVSHFSPFSLYTSFMMNWKNSYTFTHKFKFISHRLLSLDQRNFLCKITALPWNLVITS